METTNKNSEYAKKNGKKGVQPGEMMVAAICFLAAAIILFIFDLIMYSVTKGRARTPIIIQSAVCVFLLTVSLILGFAAFAQKNKLTRRRIIEEICTNTIDDEKEGTEQKENTETDTDKRV